MFVDGEIFAFVCNRAHQSDIGGGVAGTYNPAATEIFHEGIRLPPLRLVERGRLRRDLWQLLLLNSRCADLLDGDLNAMLGSTQIGAEQMTGLARDLGAAERLAYIDGILDYADRRMRAAGFGTEVSMLLQALPGECRCIVLARGAVMGSEPLLRDLTPDVRRRLDL